MFAKRLFQKAAQQLEEHRRRDPHEGAASQPNEPSGCLTSTDFDPRVTHHCGVPSTASIMALDPIQSLLAVGTLDGKIKVIGGDKVEALFVSAKQLPFKYLEFLHNQGFLVSITNDNDIQVWDLVYRRVVYTLQWESNITAFSVIQRTGYMYIGDENGTVFVLKYDFWERELVQLPYLIPSDSIAEASAIPIPHYQSVVGLLSQPYSQGNRLLIAYEHGLLVLWDITENQVVSVRGYKDLRLKDEIVLSLPKVAKNELPGNISEDEQMDKEISSLCWLSDDGSVLAVGYVDGDIMLWNLSASSSNRNQQAGKASSNDVVKLQISSDDRRLPVIVLHWSAKMSKSGHGGQLFVYGGSEIGSDEVLTILSLHWSSGIEDVKCHGRVDLTLNGSYADMVLLPTPSPTGSTYPSSAIVLTSPGQLSVYDDACLSALVSQQETKATVSPLCYAMVIPTVEPQMTVGHLGVVHLDGKFSGDLSKVVAAAKHHLKDATKTGHSEWPLTGGVPSQYHLADHQVERIYIAGYRDGSVRIWDATYPILSQIYDIEPEVSESSIPGSSASISALDFCSVTLSLVVGNECGLVHLYKLIGSSEETTVHVVTETGVKVQDIVQQGGPQYMALFSLLNSPVCTVKFASAGTRLAVGYECGRVAVFDTSAFSVLSITDIPSDSSSPVISFAVCSVSKASKLVDSVKEPKNEGLNGAETSPMFVLTKDAHIAILDSTNGNVISSQSYPGKISAAMSLHIIESTAEVSVGTHSVNLSNEDEAKDGITDSKLDCGSNRPFSESEAFSEASPVSPRSINMFVVLCCEDMISLYPMVSGSKVDKNFIQRVKLVKPCRWSRVLKKDHRDSGLVILYQSGEIEVRSFLNFEVVAETSLTSLLRWNFKTNMDKMIFSCDDGQISLVNGCELAFVSLLAHENNFRIPDSLPCLHDEVIAAAADASTNLTPDQRRSQGAGHRIFNGIIKGLKGSEVDKPEVINPEHLEGIFSKPLTLKTSLSSTQDEVIELNIDDIEIDEPVTVSSSYQPAKNDEMERKGERERLFEGASTDVKPRLRTREEIIAKYRKPEDAAAAAARARDRLVERQEKLARISQRTEELQSGAEDFASMASELAKRMENRKWWNMF